MLQYFYSPQGCQPSRVFLLSGLQLQDRPREADISLPGLSPCVDLSSVFAESKWHPSFLIHNLLHALAAPDTNNIAR